MPVTLVLETGSGLETSNSYQTASGASGYHARVGNGDEWDRYTTEEQEAALVAATRFMGQRWRWVGQRVTSGQALDWPRFGGYDSDGFLWEDAVPPAVAEACAEYALLTVSGLPLFPDNVDPLAAGPITSRSETIGPHTESVTYASPVHLGVPRWPTADRILTRAGLVRGPRRSTIRG